GNSAAAGVEKILRALGAQVMIAPNDVDIALNEINRFDGVLYFGALDAPATEQLDAELLRRSHEMVCGFMLRLLRALMQKNIETPLKIWAVTQRVHALPGDAGRAALAQAPLHGFGKAAALEHPELWGGVIDLSDPSDERELTALVNECLGGGNEMDVALRADKRFVSRLAEFSEPHKQPHEIDADATYWILGGLGALGLQTAQWFVSQGARTLVLTNRSGETEEDAAPLRGLRELGATVHIWRGDVCDLDAMNKIAGRIQHELPPLKGVIHAAGIGGVQSIKVIDETEFHNVMSAKTLGAWNLLEATQAAPLDFIVFYSSIASVWGSKNQCHYAAANQIVDALACDAASQGRPAFTINWGPWPGEGMATQSDRDRLAQMGVMALPTEALFRALQTLLSSSKPQAVAAKVEWRRLSNLMEGLGRHVFFEELRSPSNEDAEIKNQDSGVKNTIEALPVDERLGALQRHIQTTAAGILGYEDGRLPDAHDGFFQLGMDSLLAVDLKDQLARSLSISLAAPAVFSYPNAHDLATHIFNDCFEWELDKQSVGPNGANEESSKNSDEPTDDALAQKLANLESLINDQ
ncbi:SDR family NAD(P)-dependent oxidoreductase, partial [bacterium]|nr:SDR family NAD(P)-dependent oxidoreductase [bacterium]